MPHASLLTYSHLVDTCGPLHGLQLCPLALTHGLPQSMHMYMTASTAMTVIVSKASQWEHKNIHNTTCTNQGKVVHNSQLLCQCTTVITMVESDPVWVFLSAITCIPTLNLVDAGQFHKFCKNF